MESHAPLTLGAVPPGASKRYNPLNKSGIVKDAHIFKRYNPLNKSGIMGCPPTKIKRPLENFLYFPYTSPIALTGCVMYTVLLETEIPLSDFSPTFESLQDRIDAAVAALDDVGAAVEPTAQEQDLARQIFTGAKNATDRDLCSPGVVAQVAALLSEYDKTVVQSAAQLRTYITNRLLLESDSPDPRIRIKALEMLGKISDVGLFTEKTEITMRHRPTEELEQMLRERLTRVIEAETYDAPTPAHQRNPSLPDISDIVGVSV